jgi:hypothetical protein
MFPGFGPAPLAPAADGDAASALASAFALLPGGGGTAGEPTGPADAAPSPFSSLARAASVPDPSVSRVQGRSGVAVRLAAWREWGWTDKPAAVPHHSAAYYSCMPLMQPAHLPLFGCPSPAGCTPLDRLHEMLDLARANSYAAPGDPCIASGPPCAAGGSSFTSAFSPARTAGLPPPPPRARREPLADDVQRLLDSMF